AEILTGKIADHNTFDAPESVKTVEFSDFSVLSDGFTASLPPCSVARFEIR
nr:alpha-N-arabinofuranosidase [Clostridiales bacterium]